jgi:hypothetical protein
MSSVYSVSAKKSRLVLVLFIFLASLGPLFSPPVASADSFFYTGPYVFTVVRHDNYYKEASFLPIQVAGQWAGGAFRVVSFSPSDLNFGISSMGCFLEGNDLCGGVPGAWGPGSGHPVSMNVFHCQEANGFSVSETCDVLFPGWVYQGVGMVGGGGEVGDYQMGGINLECFAPPDRCPGAGYDYGPDTDTETVVVEYYPIWYGTPPNTATPTITATPAGPGPDGFPWYCPRATPNFGSFYDPSELQRCGCYSAAPTAPSNTPTLTLTPEPSITFAFITYTPIYPFGTPTRTRTPTVTRTRTVTPTPSLTPTATDNHYSFQSPMPTLSNPAPGGTPLSTVTPIPCPTSVLVQKPLPIDFEFPLPGELPGPEACTIDYISSGFWDGVFGWVFSFLSGVANAIVPGIYDFFPVWQNGSIPAFDVCTTEVYLPRVSIMGRLFPVDSALIFLVLLLFIAELGLIFS